MIHIKTENEVKSMIKGGKILADVLADLIKNVKVGVSEIEIDKLAEKMILERGGKPGFKTVNGYKHSICTATNDVVVHGIPSDYVFKKGDVVCVDAGVLLDGLHTDMAETVLIPGDNERENYQKAHFLETGKRALNKAILEAKAGNRVGHISRAIQDVVEKEGYSIVRTLVGHGVGKKLHEPPEVPGYLLGNVEKTPLLKKNMTIAIEVIYNMGKPEVGYANDDGWTISSVDGSISAVFERTVLIKDGGCEVLTK